MFDGFERRSLDTPAWRCGRAGGGERTAIAAAARYRQTHVMWHAAARGWRSGSRCGGRPARLCESFKPAPPTTTCRHSKRALAADLVAAMLTRV